MSTSLPNLDISQTTVENLKIYYEPRVFVENSTLHLYLAKYQPMLIFRERFDYNLYEVLTALKKIIKTKKLFDENNPIVVMCDQELEYALDVKALHLSEMREYVCKQLHLKETNDLSVSQPATLPATQIAQNSASLSAQVSDFYNIILPSWSSSANNVIARNNSTTQFDIEADYVVKYNFLKVLRAVEGVDQNKIIFSYRDVANLLSKYIINNIYKLCDHRNIRVIFVENDLLGAAFGVKVFARCQITLLMRQQLLVVNKENERKCRDEEANSKLDES